MLVRLSILSFFLLHAICSSAGPAVNQFEVKNLDVELGQWEFQSQNAHPWRPPARKFVEEEPGDFEYDDNSIVKKRHALEIEFGTTEWMRNRVGVEFEQERLDDPATFASRDDFDSLRLDEIAIEALVVLVTQDKFGLGIGLLAEYQYQLESDEADSIVFGPIFETNFNAWNLVVNPTFVQFFDSEGQDDKLDFAYAAHILYGGIDNWNLGLEFYGTIDRLGNSGKRNEEARLFGDHDLHRLGPIVYYIHSGYRDEQELALGLGLFFGLNAATPDFTLKWSVEYEF